MSYRVTVRLTDGRELSGNYDLVSALYTIAQAAAQPQFLSFELTDSNAPFKCGCVIPEKGESKLCQAHQLLQTVTPK